MDKFEMAMKLMQCFPKSFINHNGEFIAHAKSNTYLVFNNCQSEQELKCKVLEWFSRAAYKTQPYHTDRANDNFHCFMLDGVNEFLGTAFTYDDMELIYTYLGNAIRHDLTVRFVESGYNLEVIREFVRNRRAADGN